jgi:hypothetical protein
MDWMRYLPMIEIEILITQIYTNAYVSKTVNPSELRQLNSAETEGYYQEQHPYSVG